MVDGSLSSKLQPVQVEHVGGRGKRMHKGKRGVAARVKQSELLIFSKLLPPNSHRLLLFRPL